MGRLIEMRHTIDWIPLDSSVLETAAYVARRRWLYLRFQSGEIYRYFDFPPQLYRDFRDGRLERHLLRETHPQSLPIRTPS
jgi:hypothetical protein